MLQPRIIFPPLIGAFIREKYVTRQEFDELKARFDDLATLVQRYLPLNSPSRQMGYHHALPGISGAQEAVRSYHPNYLTHRSAQAPTQAYHTTPLPSSSPQASQPPPTQRHDRIDSPHLRSPIDPHLTSAVSSPLNLRSRSPTSSSMRHRITDASDTTTATTSSGSSSHVNNTGRSARPLTPAPKGSLPPSLASITSPYIVPEPQSKNYCAQMLMPGDHLRTLSANLNGPAVSPVTWWAIHALFPFLILLQLPRIIAALLPTGMPARVKGAAY
ncbi:hypothetical protein AX15_001466 [Amanita polypyramis BW_CC]|nr:hypothetical protein AX15_001466 [Amanita polypyramis BW_CC]